MFFSRFLQSCDAVVLAGSLFTSPITAHLVHAPRHGERDYVLWGADKVTPEGGMNDKGVFFDAAALPHRFH